MSPARSATIRANGRISDPFGRAGKKRPARSLAQADGPWHAPARDGDRSRAANRSAVKNSRNQISCSAYYGDPSPGRTAPIRPAPLDFSEPDGGPRRELD